MFNPGDRVRIHGLGVGDMFGTVVAPIPDYISKEFDYDVDVDGKSNGQVGALAQMLTGSNLFPFVTDELELLED